jgi:hypothetical protein
MRKLEASTGRGGECPACALCDRYEAAEAELGRRHGGIMRAGRGERIVVRSACAWCGRVTSDVIWAEGDAAAYLRAVFPAIDAGRYCAPEIKAQVAEKEALLRGTPWWTELEALRAARDAELRALPYPRFPYICTVAGCGCWSEKGSKPQTYGL